MMQLGLFYMFQPVGPDHIRTKHDSHKYPKPQSNSYIVNKLTDGVAVTNPKQQLQHSTVNVTKTITK